MQRPSQRLQGRMADMEVPAREGGEGTFHTPKSPPLAGGTGDSEAVMGTQTQDSNKLPIGV